MAIHEPIELTEEHHRRFQADGVVKVEQAVDPDWVASIHEVADTQLASPGKWVGDSAADGDGPGRLFTDRYLWRDVPAVNDFVFNSGVAGLAGRLLGAERVRFFFDHLLVKEPGTADPTPWHQDIPYWPFLGKQIASVWVSASDLTVEESSLEFVRGSHSWDRYFTPKAFTAGGSSWAEANEGDTLPDIEATRDEHDIIGFDVAAGDALVFSAWSGPRITWQRRGSPPGCVVHPLAWRRPRSGTPRPSSDPAVTQADTVAVPGAYPADDDRFPIGWARAA